MRVTGVARWVVCATLLALAVAQELDCTSKFGPGCLQCDNVTVKRQPRDYQDADGAQDNNGGDRRWASSWQGRGLKHRGGGRGGWGCPWGPDPNTDTTRLVCTACDAGYTLVMHHNSTYGSCRCATGWGVVQANSTDSSSPWWERRRGPSKCFDCSLEGKVPLTDESNLKLSWDGSNWVLVLASSPTSASVSSASVSSASVNSGSVSAQHAGGHGDSSWHQGWGAWGVRPPYYAGQCVSCPTGSAPNADSSACVAGGSVAPEPSPSPSPAPSPPTDLGACLQVTDADVATLQDDIAATCSASGGDSLSVPLDAFGWAEDPNMMNVYFSTDKDIMTDTGDAAGLTEASCSKMSQLAGQTVTVTWLVNDAGISCSPSTGTLTLTIPTWSSTAGSTAPTASVVQNMAALLPMSTGSGSAVSTTATARRRAARRRASTSSFKLVARKDQQGAATSGRSAGGR